MRYWIVALLVILLPFSYAVVVESTGKTGKHMVLYGDVATYENDGKVYVYDFTSKEESEIGRGSNPSIFGFIVVF